jgi:WD40 repeat protein
MNRLTSYGAGSHSSGEDEDTTEKKISQEAVKLQKVKLNENRDSKVAVGSTLIQNEVDEATLPPNASERPTTSTASDSEESDDSDDDDDLIGPPIPTEFLQPRPIEPAKEEEEEDDDLIGPPIPGYIQRAHDAEQQSASTATVNPEKAASSDESDDDDDEDPYNLPVTHHIDFKHGSKAVTALAVDPTGTRFATGSLDYEVRFWDFVGMNSSLQSFRSLYPCGNYPIKALAYSSTGDTVLIISGMSQAKVLDRDGHEKLECVKGDQYISDMARTKGHPSPLTDGCWHPRIREEFITSSEDGTVRLWNVNSTTQHKSIIKCRSKNGLKTTPTTCAYNRDATMIACACEDGSFQLWDTRKMFVNAAKVIHGAHQNGTTTSRIAFSYSATLVSTRGGDDTLKLWDLRMFRNPLRTADNLFSRYGGTDCMFNPQDNVIITGVSLEKGEKEGKLLFFNATTLEKVDEIIVTDSHVIKTHWHPRLQQIFVGCGNGNVRVYYGDDSIKGAKLCATKRPSKAKQMEAVAVQQIITPHALPLFRQDRQKSQRKKMEKERLDPVKSRRPDLPIKSGQGGRVANAGSTLSSYVIRNLGLSKRVEDDQDPRQAILKYAKEAAENPYWVSPAYAKTQPKAIFASESAADDDQPAEKKKKVL